MSTAAMMDPFSAVEGSAKKKLKHKRRYCRTPGCTNIVKSQGLCQRHGAKPRMCKIQGCKKQAQGNFDGMCKSHFKAHKQSTTPLPPRPVNIAAEPPPPEGLSVYDTVIPASIAWGASGSNNHNINNNDTNSTVMPLIQHLRDGFEDPNKPPAWHRNEERRARGLWPVHNPAIQLESWERELVWTEILLLTGNPDSSFRHLARAWGRDKGFHTVLAQFICERHGNVERKKRKKMAETDGSLNSSSNTSSSYSYEDVEPGVPVDVVGSDLYGDQAMYGDAEYNEALAADLLNFDEHPPPPPPAGKPNERMFSFEHHHHHQDVVSSEEEPTTHQEEEEDDDDDFRVAVIDATAAV